MNSISGRKDYFFSVKRQCGFTLAEVLITLTIIGVVAAMSIPAVISDTSNSEYVTRLKKAYASMSQALQKVSEEVGCINDLGCTGIFSTVETAGNAISKNMNVTKNCGTSSIMNISDEGCWAPNYYLDGSGTPYDYDMGGNYKFITADGTSYLITSLSPNCTNDQSISNTGSLMNVCGVLYIDVNGKKGPNRRGKDVFGFYTTKSTQIIPHGTEDDSTYGYWRDQRCGQGAITFLGHTCAARIMEEGWEMNY